MGANEKRFYVYSHDSDGDLIANIADNDKLIDAIDSAADYLTNLYPLTTGVTVRVVDRNADHTTCWIAGQGNQIVPLEGSV